MLWVDKVRAREERGARACARATPTAPRNTDRSTAARAATHAPPPPPKAKTSPHPPPKKTAKQQRPSQHRPATLDKFALLHADAASRLRRLVAAGDFPHALFYGPAGAGKKTLVAALLREVYGPGADRVRVDTRPWTLELPGGRKGEVELTALSSPYHVELNPADAGGMDRYVVQEVIKDMARNRPLHEMEQQVQGQQRDQQQQQARGNLFGAGARGGGGGGAAVGADDGGGGGGDENGGGAAPPAAPPPPRSFKVLVLHDVDRLSREAQQSLRRTMEKYSSACRLVMTATSASKVMAPLRSRCMAVRVAAPTDAQVASLVREVGRREGVAIPPALAARLAVLAERNLRRALLAAEVCRAQAGAAGAAAGGGGGATSNALPTALPEDCPVHAADWQLYCREVAGDIVTEQSPRRLYLVRGKLYELLANCVPAELILKTVTLELLRRCDDDLKGPLVDLAATYEHRMAGGGSKPIFHLEAFVAKFMSVFKQYLVNAFAA